jgi:hypothetical protein
MQLTIPDSIIAPRITRAQLKTKYTSSEREVFVTVQTVNVTFSVHFFFDGKVWIELNYGNFGTTNDTVINPLM